MKYLKQQTTNNKSVLGKGVLFTINNEVIMDTTNVMLIPKGTTLQRPVSPENGHFRYNTDVEEFEAYRDSQWRKVRYKEPRSIVQQTLTGSTGVETIFGPLDNQDADFAAPDSAQSMIVLIENVFQISVTNYNLVQNPSSAGTGAEITAPNAVIGTEYLITDSGTSNFTLIGSSDNNVGTVFTASDNGTTGTGTLREVGWYIEFASSVPFGKPVTVLHNFNK